MKKPPTLSDSVVARARARLLGYYATERRDLPWRRTRDPYAIWVSEVMLQQTRVETVVPYYLRFMQRFPSVAALADAPDDAVLAAWAGLGYYRRARMLHSGARTVRSAHGGVVPCESVVLQTLPGVGRYTAGAIASIAFGRREPVVDGNIERVFSRWAAIDGDPARPRTRERYWSLAARFADCTDPGAINQSLMELGATVCTPVSPRCDVCPLRASCKARRRGSQDARPARSTLREIPTERWSALVVHSPSLDAVRLTRAQGTRFGGMLVPFLRRGVAASGDWEAQRIENSVRVGRVRHVLTHAVMDVTVFRVESVRRSRAEWFATARLADEAVPAITWRILARAGISPHDGESTERPSRSRVARPQRAK